MVYPFEVGEQEEPGFFGRLWRGIRRNTLGPPPIPYADVEISFSAGMLDGEGLFLLRPSWIVDPYFAIDGFAGLSPRAEKDIFFDGHDFSTTNCRLWVNVNNTTVDAETNIRIPIIRGIANSIALRQVEKRRPQTDALTRQKISQSE